MLPSPKIATSLRPKVRRRPIARTRSAVGRHWRLIAALWNRHGYGEERAPGVISDHRQLIRAFAARDTDVAACLAMAHAAKAKQELLARMLHKPVPVPEAAE
jgi:DNA-binding GntR family transcriptional regulator